LRCCFQAKSALKVSWHIIVYYNIPLVTVKNYNVNYPASLKHDKIENYTKVVGVSRRFESGVLMAASGKHRWLGGLGCEGLHYTACEITKVVLLFCLLPTCR
jgi:hypothetical protein